MGQYFFANAVSPCFKEHGPLFLELAWWLKLTLWFKGCTFDPYLNSAELHSSVGSVADLRTGSGWFYPRHGQYSFRGGMIVIATGFIPLSPLSVVPTIVMWESSQGL